MWLPRLDFTDWGAFHRTAWHCVFKRSLNSSGILLSEKECGLLMEFVHLFLSLHLSCFVCIFQFSIWLGRSCLGSASFLNSLPPTFWTVWNVNHEHPVESLRIGQTAEPIYMYSWKWRASSMQQKDWKRAMLPHGKAFKFLQENLQATQANPAYPHRKVLWTGPSRDGSLPKSPRTWKTDRIGLLDLLAHVVHPEILQSLAWTSPVALGMKFDLTGIVPYPPRTPQR